MLEEQPGWQVVAETGNGLDAVRLAADLQPDVVILDIGMPQLNGLEAARQITKRVPAARVLILSMHADEVHITKAIEAGAVGLPGEGLRRHGACEGRDGHRRGSHAFQSGRRGRAARRSTGGRSHAGE
ncbi:MAG: response regulator transcription factor [Comamonadaceae bacterium]|nr:response regulator transcription factor [Comamonadaceae bacterium]